MRRRHRPYYCSTKAMSFLLVLPLLVLAAGAIYAVARFLGRPIPPVVLAVFVVATTLPFPRAFVSNRTPLPLDHVTLTAPWVSLGKGPPYNAYLDDVVTQILPWAEASRLAWKGGELPLRDRWNGGGMALAANSLSQAYSPLSLIALPLPLATAAFWIGCVKLLLAMAGMWLWVRELGASRGAAVFAGVAYGLSLNFTQWLFCPQTEVFCLWPWTLFLIELCRGTSARWRCLAALTAVFAASVLAGHPESLALGVLFAGLWILGRWAAGDMPDAPRVIGRVVGAGVLAVGLTAFLLVPSYIAIQASNRLPQAEKPYWDPYLSLVPHGPVWRGVVTAFFARALGDLVHAPVIPGATGAIAEMDLGYFSIAGLCAALMILRPGSKRLRATWVLAGLGVCGLGVAVAQWPFAEIFARIPEIRLVFPLRFYSWLALAGPAVAALELDRHAKDLGSRGRTVFAAVAIPLLLGLAAVLVYKHLRPEYVSTAIAFQKKQVIVTLALLALAAALALVALRLPSVYVAGLTLLCAAELAWQWQGLYRLYDPALFYPELPMVRFLHGQTSPFRVTGESTSIFPNMNVFAGAEDIRVNDGVERLDYVAFLDATLGYPPHEYFKHIGNPDASVLDFLNVRYLVAWRDFPTPGPRWKLAYTGADGNVWENLGVLPRAFAPTRVRLVARATAETEPLVNANAAFGGAFAQIAANRDWRDQAWVLWDRDGELVNGQAEITDYRESTNSASFHARVTGGITAVVLSLAQDGGWSARDEKGSEIAVLRANGPFLAVALPPGEHRVFLSYASPGTYAGAIISVATLLLLLGGVAIALARRTSQSA
jgi:hypothetical protein